MVLSRKRLQASFQRIEEEKPDLTLQRRRRPTWEIVVFVLLIALVLYAIVFFGQQQRQHYREIMLRQQLWQMRNAIAIYFTQQGEMPLDLRALAMAQIADPRTGVFFPLLENARIDEKGNVIDPLGYPYIYQRETGKVSSSAPCCTSW